ncbi:MAG: trypsin-like peptidase domain-containing protein [Gaiella sp.]|nr:trypsin-like peptidase domain-containing protein [Gaiella sp.]
MIVGPGWGFLGLVAIGLAAVVLVPGCGLLVVDEAPASAVRLTAPRLVDADPVVEAVPAGVWTVTPARAQHQVLRGQLRVKTPACKGRPTGSGFGLDATLLLARRDVLPGASPLRIAPRNGPARTLRATRAYRLGELVVARVERRLPRRLPSGGNVVSGASVAVVGYPFAGRPRLHRGVVVDRVPGGPFGVRGRVVRLTAALGPGDPGGPVIDAKGRVVAIAFASDPGTGLALAVPIVTLRSLVAARVLEALEPCDDG